MASDKGTSYAAPLSGLMIDKNYFHFSITSKAIGSAVCIDGIDGSLIQNNLRIDDQKNTHIEIYWNEDKLVFKGTIAPHQSLKKKISPLRSEIILCYKIKQILLRNNITVKKGVVFIHDKKTSQLLDANSQMIQTHLSKPLLSILIPLMKQSDNLIADSLYLKILHLFNPRCRHWQDGAAVIPNLINQYYGVNLNNAVVMDGSGLSRHNRIQPITMWYLLNKLIQHNTLLELLPAPQEQNTTLASRLIPLSLKAKTGSMTNINGLAGFYLPQNSLPQAFFLMMSNFIAPIKDINEQQKLFLQRYLAD